MALYIEQLKPGVFVHDFNSGWLHHPSLHIQITIKTEREIEKIIKFGIREVYIDTTNGLDVDDASTKQEVDSEIEGKLHLTTASPSDGKSRVPLRNEIRRAKALAARSGSLRDPNPDASAFTSSANSLTDTYHPRPG